MEKIPILSPIDVVRAEEKRRNRSQHPYYALFSSLHGGIITDASRMNVPLDDHMVHRGHAVFDTCTLANGKIYLLDAHLERFFNSARLAHIQVPYTRAELKQIVSLTCAASRERDAAVRFWLSAGGGDFNLSPPEDTETFWVLVFKPKYAYAPAREVTILPHEVPMKPQLLANMKSNNYMLNSLVQSVAKTKGGKNGLWVDEDGNLAEFPTSAVIIVDKDGCIRTPMQDNILTGITFLRVWDTLKNELARHPSCRNMKMGNITVVEAYEAKEIISLSGDTHIIPVVELDGKQIGNGMPGPVFNLISDFILNEAKNGTHDSIRVPYEQYTIPPRSRL